MSDQTNEQIMAKALSEIARVAALCIHQNIGRWRMSIDHDKRSYDILHRIQREASDALSSLNSDRK